MQRSQEQNDQLNNVSTEVNKSNVKIFNLPGQIAQMEERSNRKPRNTMTVLELQPKNSKQR